MIGYFSVSYGGGSYSWIERPCPMDVGSSTATRLSVDQKETGFGILVLSSFGELIFR